MNGITIMKNSPLTQLTLISAALLSVGLSSGSWAQTAVNQNSNQSLDITISIVEPDDQPDAIINRIALPPAQGLANDTQASTSQQTSAQLEQNLETELKDIKTTSGQVLDDATRVVSDSLSDTIGDVLSGTVDDTLNDVTQLPSDLVDTLPKDLVDDLVDQLPTDALPLDDLIPLDEDILPLDDLTPLDPKVPLNDLGQPLQELNNAIEPPATPNLNELVPAPVLDASGTLESTSELQLTPEIDAPLNAPLNDLTPELKP